MPFIKVQLYLFLVYSTPHTTYHSSNAWAHCPFAFIANVEFSCPLFFSSLINIIMKLMAVGGCWCFFYYLFITPKVLTMSFKWLNGIVYPLNSFRQWRQVNYHWEDGWWKGEGNRWYVKCLMFISYLFSTWSENEYFGNEALI